MTIEQQYRRQRDGMRRQWVDWGGPVILLFAGDSIRYVRVA